MCEQLLQQQKRKGVLHCIVTSDEKWIHYDNQSEKSHGISPAMHQHPRQSRISMAPSLCSVFGGISRMSCYELLQPNEIIIGDWY